MYKNVQLRNVQNENTLQIQNIIQGNKKIFYVKC